MAAKGETKFRSGGWQTFNLRSWPFEQRLDRQARISADRGADKALKAEKRSTARSQASSCLCFHHPTGLTRQPDLNGGGSEGGNKEMCGNTG